MRGSKEVLRRSQGSVSRSGLKKDDRRKEEEEDTQDLKEEEYGLESEEEFLIPEMTQRKMIEMRFHIIHLKREFMSKMKEV